MTAVTVRNLKPETHQALKDRARRHGRSTEAEIRSILEDAVSVPTASTLADELAAIGRDFNITNEFDNLRDKTPARIITFE
jgi:plasmid stability protein